MRTNLFSSLKWISFVSNRFNKVDRYGRTSVTAILASLGIGFGVMALIVVLSVMNGFQGQFIDAIMEISSYHIRVEGNNEEFTDWCMMQKNISSVTPFYEAQGLFVGKNNKQSAGILRAVPEDICIYDKGFQEQIKIVSGSFDISSNTNIVIGYDLAKSLGVAVGDSINILALSGASDVSLLSSDRYFVVSGIFYCGYGDINSAYSFISLGNGKQIFGKSAELTYGIKLVNPNLYAKNIQHMQNHFPNMNFQSWQNYNRSFFGVLRMEKNMLMLMVLLIFVVVAVNIYNGMRRMVFERKDDIAILSAFGANSRDIQSIFIYKGLLTGVKGAIPGVILGLFFCINIDKVFMTVSKMIYYIQLLVAGIISPESMFYLGENSMFAVYASIPAKMNLMEIFFIFFFGVFSSLIAAWGASRNILKLTISEALRDE